ncbi:MAG: hypothetical protein PHQ32_00125 [Firmicutes bacterium]|nr:hypothetical protein [Bacillota bacterium]
MINKKFKRIAFILVGLTILLISGFIYIQPIRMVSLDAGPQVEYWSNYFGIVVKVKGIGPEGEALINDSSKPKILNHNIEDALNETLNSMRKSAVINYEEPVTLLVAVTGENTHASTLLAASIKEMLVEKASRLNWEGSEIRVLSLTKKQWDIAKLSEFSPGRYYLLHSIADNAILVDKSKFDFNKYALLSVRELLDLENNLVIQQQIKPVLTPVAKTTTSKASVVSKTTTKATVTPTKTVVKAPVSSAPTSGIDSITSASPK